MLHRTLCWPLLALLAGAPLVQAAEPVPPQLVVTPRARALSASATNRPFLAATHAMQAVNLAAAGYREAEFIVRGNASIYEWTGAPRQAALTVRDAGVSWATRMLVRRPVEAGKASGLVVVELLDPGSLYDVAPLWGLSWQHFTRRGDVWVGLTVKPAAAAALKRFDPVRYGSLSFGFTQRAECRPAPEPAGTPGAGDPRANPPDAENGLAWDLIAQTGALLRSSSKENPLLDLAPRHIIAAGYAQAGGYAITYANALHRVMRLGDGAPVYDGYLAAATTSAVPINQCAAALDAGDPRRTVLPRDVPFVVAMTESGFNREPLLRRDDSDDPADLFRLYDIAGSGQVGTFAAGVPTAADLPIAGFGPPAEGLCIEARSDYPVGLAFNAIWQQYAEWLRAGTPLASLPRIQIDATGQVVRDANGNAQGGWRLPQLELPLAAYSGSATPRDASDRARSTCALTGVMRPFDAATLKAMYRTRAEYLRQFNAAVDVAVTERRLTPADGAALKAPAARTLPAF